MITIQKRTAGANHQEEVWETIWMGNGIVVGAQFMMDYKSTHGQEDVVRLVWEGHYLDDMKWEQFHPETKQ